MPSLVIVESASKCKTIKKYLGDDYYVCFSAGHICDLPKDSLGINTDNWTASYKPTNKKIIENIRGLVRKCDNIYIASDPDIEGEAIAFHIKNVIKDLIKNKQCYRIKFNEITKKVILNAIEHPEDVDLNIVEAQETRRMADRIIGYKISPLLWKRFSNNFLSAGRVQIASLIICINQRNRILNKEIIPEWTISGKFNIATQSLEANLIDEDNKIWKTVSNADALLMLNKLQIGVEYTIQYEKVSRCVSPYPPYTTTTMQQDAYNKLRITSKTTMKLAQDLYENGYITYMRTDSVAIAEEAKFKILNYVKQEYGEHRAKYRKYKNKIANAQEAHEAIRITKPEIMSTTLGASHNKLYEMIWRRSIACLMTDAEYTDFKILLTGTDTCTGAGEEEETFKCFKCTQSFLTAEGFYLAYEPDKAKEDYADFELLMRRNKCKSYEFSSTGEVPNIPSMYNEVQLIKELEKEGIGRPSTYATTIDKLLSKKYVEHGMNPQQSLEVECYKKNKSGLSVHKNTIKLGGKQKDLLIPTVLGINVIEYIYNIADYLCDLKLTSKMEADMDEIMLKKCRKSTVLNVLYTKILQTIGKQETIQELKQNKEDKENKEDKQNKDKEFICTRYGACYYNSVSKKYTNIEPYLKWRKKSLENLDENDKSFIKSLPKKIELDGKMFEMHLGRYGLYLKDMAGNNVKLDKALWNNYV